MPDGGGVYDPEIQDVVSRTNAGGAILIVIGGNRGSGFGAAFRHHEGGEAMALEQTIEIIEKCLGQLRHDLARLRGKARGN